MAEQDQQTLKLLLKKFARSELLLLSEAAQRLKVSDDYLRQFISTGKVKAFKAGQDWFIEEDWVNDFRIKLKSHLQEEIKQSGRPAKKSNWIKTIAPKKSRLADFLAAGWDRPVWAAYGLAVLALIFAALVAPIRMSPNRIAVRDSFVSLTRQTYSQPSASLATIKAIKSKTLVAKINDEDLTRFFKRILRWSRPNYPGQVAGELETGVPWPSEWKEQ